MTTILYGVDERHIDITRLAARVCEKRNSFSVIPAGDLNRVELFGDPNYGQVKHIQVGDEVFENSRECNVVLPKSLPYVGNPHTKLKKIHEKLRFTGGNISDEYPEQIMAVSFINPNDIVLEIGSNVGRNTLVIASILSDSKNLTTLETDPGNVVLLHQNKRANFFNFHIVNAALSKRKLWQHGWVTVPSEESPGNDWFPVKTIGFDEIKRNFTSFRYEERSDECLRTSNEVRFNVLVADCEGALYYIIQDFPEIFTDLKTIIVENDYRNIDHKNFVESAFKEHGFTLAYSTNSLEATSYGLPCHLEFFQVWCR